MSENFKNNWLPIIVIGGFLLAFWGYAKGKDLLIENYYLKNDCKPVGSSLQMSQGSENRFGLGDEPREYEEPIYYCSKLRERIYHSELARRATSWF